MKTNIYVNIVNKDVFFWKLLIAVAGRKHKKILVNYSQVLYFNTMIF